MIPTAVWRKLARVFRTMGFGGTYRAVPVWTLPIVSAFWRSRCLRFWECGSQVYPNSFGFQGQGTSTVNSGRLFRDVSLTVILLAVSPLTVWMAERSIPANVSAAWRTPAAADDSTSATAASIISSTTLGTFHKLLNDLHPFSPALVFPRVPVATGHHVDIVHRGDPCAPLFTRQVERVAYLWPIVLNPISFFVWPVRLYTPTVSASVVGDVV